jgi:hypothetical protein
MIALLAFFLGVVVFTISDIKIIHSHCQVARPTFVICPAFTLSVTHADYRKDPVLECTHKNVEKCHFTYKTIFTPIQEQVWELIKPCSGDGGAWVRFRLKNISGKGNGQMTYPPCLSNVVQYCISCSLEFF